METTQSKRIKMTPSLVHKAHLKASESGKTLGRWLEEAIDEKIAGGKEVK